ncbi:MAG: hypothetical protein WB762_16540 [Candidatus Sulfotelmatobacter sp.]
MNEGKITLGYAAGTGNGQPTAIDWLTKLDDCQKRLSDLKKVDDISFLMRAPVAH